jgi:hypothetical protein
MFSTLVDDASKTAVVASLRATRTSADAEVYRNGNIRKQRVAILRKLAPVSTSNAIDLAFQCMLAQRVAGELPLPVAYRTFEQFPCDVLDD